MSVFDRSRDRQARHLAFAPNGKFAYAVNEMGQSTTAFSWDAAR